MPFCSALEVIVGANPPNLIAGWEQCVMKMSLGEKATLKIPADMAYAAPRRLYIMMMLMRSL